MEEIIKLLLVDDEESFVDLLSKRLKMRGGFDVQYVLNGEAALEKLREASFDVAVVDVKMPGIDGIETLRRMKDNHPGMEVIMLTGHATLNTAVEGLKYDAFDYIEKPVELETLISKVRDAFNSKYQI